MPELTTPAVGLYTAGRLDKDDPETARLLSAALAAARRWCGWHVTPVKTNDPIVLDGPGGHLLALPTLALESIGSIVDDATTYFAADLYVSGKGMVKKRDSSRWSTKFGAITATITHGYADVPDFDEAILSMIDRQSLAPSGGRLKAAGPFIYDVDTVNGGFSQAELSKLAPFRLERRA